jgi:hypothetical protein
MSFLSAPRFAAGWVVGVLVAGASLAPAAETPLNLLFFGNSFSQGGVEYQVQHFAKVDGHATPTVLLDSQGGQDLAYHVNEVKTNPQLNVAHSLIGTKKWDYVVMQGNSTEPTRIGNVTNFRSNAVALFDAVRTSPGGQGTGAKGVLFETWARAPGHLYYGGPDGTDYRKAWNSPYEMQSELTSAYAGALADLAAASGPGAVRLAPVGQAFQKTGFDLSLYQSELYHQSNAGRLLSSLLLYRTIYDEQVSDITFAEASQYTYWYNGGVDAATWGNLTALADSMTIVPEPGALTLAAAGAATLVARRRRAR